MEEDAIYQTLKVGQLVRGCVSPLKVSPSLSCRYKLWRPVNPSHRVDGIKCMSNGGVILAGQTMHSGFVYTSVRV